MEEASLRGAEQGPNEPRVPISRPKLGGSPSAAVHPMAAPIAPWALPAAPLGSCCSAGAPRSAFGRPRSRLRRPSPWSPACSAAAWELCTAGLPLHDGARRLAEALLLVAAGSVRHEDGELGLHRDVVLKGDVVDLHPSHAMFVTTCWGPEKPAPRRSPVLAAPSSSLPPAAAAHLDIVEGPLAEQLNIRLGCHLAARRERENGRGLGPNAPLAGKGRPQQVRRPADSRVPPSAHQADQGGTRRGHGRCESTIMRAHE
jgi:hypothetical protein